MVVIVAVDCGEINGFSGEVGVLIGNIFIEVRSIEEHS